jgi:2-phosphosulfolactate phosphatase
MIIKILQLVKGAREATGLTIVIDVFRAFSLACYAFDRGAEKIIPIGDIDLAYKLKKDNPDYILMGERNEKIMPGFDFGNSPTHILNQDFKKKTIIHTTSAGTQGLVNAVNAKEILTGSFVNAGAIVKYIRITNPETVSLVCMGYSAQYPIEEDTYCAEYIRNELEEKSTDFTAMIQNLRKGSGSRFFEPGKQTFAPLTDFGLCTELNRFNFIIKAFWENQNIVLKKINLSGSEWGK